MQVHCRNIGACAKLEIIAPLAKDMLALQTISCNCASFKIPEREKVVMAQINEECFVAVCQLELCRNTFLGYLSTF